MSLAELLPAIRALPRDDRMQLAKLLVDEDAKSFEIPEHILRLLPPPDFVVPMWKPDLDAEGQAVVMQALRELKEQT